MKLGTIFVEYLKLKKNIDYFFQYGIYEELEIGIEFEIVDSETCIIKYRKYINNDSIEVNFKKTEFYEFVLKDIDENKIMNIDSYDIEKNFKGFISKKIADVILKTNM